MVMLAYMSFTLSVMVFNVRVSSRITSAYFVSLSATWSALQYYFYARRYMSAALYANAFAHGALLLFWTTLYYPAPRTFERLRVYWRAVLTFLFYSTGNVFVLGDQGMLAVMDRIDTYEAETQNTWTASCARALVLVLAFVFQVCNPVFETLAIRSFTAVARSNLRSQAVFSRRVELPKSSSPEIFQEHDLSSSSAAGADKCSLGSSTRHEDVERAISAKHAAGDDIDGKRAPSMEINEVASKAYVFRLKYWCYYLLYFYKIAIGRRLLFRAGWSWLLIFCIVNDFVFHLLTFGLRVQPVVYAFDGVILKFHNPPDSLDAVLGSRSHASTEDDEEAAGQIARSLPTLLTTATTSHSGCKNSASPSVDDISTRESSHTSAFVDKNSCEAEAAETRISNFYDVQGSSAAFDVAQRKGFAGSRLFPSAENTSNANLSPPPVALHARGHVGPSTWLQRLTRVSPAEIEYFRPVCLAVQYENFMRYQVRLVVSLTCSLAYFLLPLSLRGSQMPGQAPGFPLVQHHRDSDEDWVRYMFITGAFLVADMLEAQSSSLEDRMRLLMQNVLQYFSLAEFFFVVFNVTLLWTFWLLWSPFKLKKLQELLDLPNLDWDAIFRACPEITIN
eukprot:g1743.t1